MGGFLRQSTASQSRALGPFLDDTDQKTPETALTIANTDVKLVINGAASVDKNSGGGTHRVNGVYSVTFDATDTATVGELAVSVVMAGALPVSATFTVVEEAVYDSLYAAAADNQTATVTAIKAKTDNLPADPADESLLEAAIAAIPAAPTAAAIADAVWDEALAGHVTAGTAGKRLGDLSTSTPPTAAQIRTEIDSNSTQLAAIKAKTDNLPSDPADDSDLDAQLATIAGYLDTEIAAIKAKTDLIPASPAAVGSAMTLSSGERDTLTDTIWNEATSGHTTAGTTGKALIDGSTGVFRGGTLVQS